MTSFIETLNHWGDHFLKFAWPMLWQSSLLIAIFFVLDFALRRKIRAAIRYALWLMVLVKLLLPPSLALPTSLAWWVLTSPQSPAKPQTTGYVVTYGEQTIPTFPLQFQSAPVRIQPKMSVAAWTLAASGAVSMGLLAWLLIRWRQISQRVRRAKASEKLIPLLDEARRLVYLRPGIQLKLTEDSMSPAVCGLFRPVILLPRSLVEKLSAGQLRAVLLHELIHLRRGDVWVNCAQALLQIVYWWHPLLWLANARIRRVREEAVDDAVMLALRDDAEIYAPTLLEVAKLAFNRPLASLGLVGILESRSALRQRIERLVNFHAPRKAGLTVVSILGILVFSAVALPMGEAPEKTNEPTVSASIVSNSHFQAFQAALHALEQRTGVVSLAEPEAVTTAGRGANRINRIVVPDKINISTQTTNAEESSELAQDGKLLYEMGKFDEAEAKLEAALALNPDNQAAHYYLALIEQSRWAAKSGGQKLIYPRLDNNLNYVSNRTGGIQSEDTRVFQINQPMKEDDLKKHLLDAGVKIPPTAFVYMDGGILLVRGSDQQLNLVERVVQKLNGFSSPESDTNHFIKRAGITTVVNSSAANPNLEMRVFKLDLLTFPAALRGIPGLQTNNVPTMAESLFNKLGVDLTAPGRSVAFNDRLGLLFVKATALELDTIEHIIQALNQIPPQIHIKARFMEVPESDIESVLKAGMAVDAKEKNAVEIITADKMKSLLHQLESGGKAVMLAEPEAETTSGRQVQVRSDNSTVDLLPWLLSDGYTLNLTTIVSAPEKFTAMANIWDGQTLALVSSNADGTNRLVVFATATVVDSAGNPVHTADELPFNPSTIPVQPKILIPSP